MRGEKSRKGIDIARDVEKKKRREQTKSDGRKKVFCLWKIQAHGL